MLKFLRHIKVKVAAQLPLMQAPKPFQGYTASGHKVGR